MYTNMADRSDDDEGPTESKVPRVMKTKDQDKRLIVILERASLETVKVRFLVGTFPESHTLGSSLF